MRRVLLMASCLSLSAAAVGCDAAPPSTNAAPGADGATVLASLALEDGHTVQFLEVAPGETLTSESGIYGVHTPVITAEMRGRSASDLYRALTPPQTPVPAALVAADERAARLAKRVDDETRGTVESARGAGPEFYDDGEQQWFRDTQCNGAQACAQGWDWATISSNRKLGGASAIGMVGREGHQNGAMDTYRMETRCSGFLCTSQTSWWDLKLHQVVVPGHWVSNSSSNTDNYYRWELTGAGGDTQVSLAARF
jgi:hypothetical protein